MYDKPNETEIKKVISKKRLKDLAGLKEVKLELNEFIDMINNRDKYIRFGVTPPSGLLLDGPPGNGKSLIAEVIAGETGASYFRMAGPEFVNKYVGVGASTIRNLFKIARKEERSIIFIDEIDAVAAKREEDNNGEYNKTLNQLLVEMTSPDNKNITIIGATNRKEMLDPAILREGRLTRHITIGNPDKLTRYALLKLYSRKKPLSDDIDLREIARQSSYMSAAGVENIFTEAALHAIRNGKDKIHNVDMMAGLARAQDGLPNKKKIIQKEKDILTYHECGHLVAVYLLRTGKISKITIIPHGDAMGFVRYHDEDDRYIYTKEEIMNKMIVSMAGKVVEKIKFNIMATGPSGDLESIEYWAHSMVTKFGMSENYGYMAMTRKGSFMDELIHTEMKNITDEVYRLTYELISSNMDLVEYMVSILQEEETISGERATLLMDEFMKNK